MPMGDGAAIEGLRFDEPRKMQFERYKQRSYAPLIVRLLLSLIGDKACRCSLLELHTPRQRLMAAAAFSEITSHYTAAAEMRGAQMLLITAAANIMTRISQARTTAAPPRRPRFHARASIDDKICCEFLAHMLLAQPVSIARRRLCRMTSRMTQPRHAIL
jgi:hypothetical protein